MTWLYVLAGIYLLLCLAVWCFQEVLLFPGQFGGRAANAAQLPGVETDWLEVEGGRRYRVARGEPRGAAKGVLVYFLGNGEDLASGVRVAAEWAAHGYRILVSEYPGYGESEGSPSYAGVIENAERSLVEGQGLAQAAGLPLLLGGHSLGTFSAMHLAAQGAGERLLLFAPPTSIAAAGQARFPFLPVGMLLRHPFDNLGKAAQIRIPTLIVHGAMDTIVPHRMGQELSEAIPQARLITVPGAGHNSLPIFPSGPLGADLAAFLAGGR